MPTIQVQDRAPLTKTRKLADGRLAAVARVARAGVQQYTGAELGRPDLSIVNVYRPESEVFSEDAMASFGHKTLTLDHPDEPVDARNWKRVAVGYTEGRVARDGGFVEIPLMVADAGAVAAYESGQATQLSAGYSCSLTFEDGIAPDGTAYQAVQRSIIANHIALVAAGRAGPECRIGDSIMTDVDRRGQPIDQAVRTHLDKLAKDQSVPLDQMVADMTQAEISSVVTDVAAAYAKSLASGGAVSGLADTAMKARTEAFFVAHDMQRAARLRRAGIPTHDHSAAKAARDAAAYGQYGGPPPPAAQRSVHDTQIANDAARSVRDLARVSSYS